MSVTAHSPTRLIPIDEVPAFIVPTATGRPSRATIYRLIKCGELRKVNIGRRGFVTSDSIDAYLDRLAGNQGGAADQQVSAS